LKQDLEPYIKYYENFNLKNEALEFYEQRLDTIYDNEDNHKEMMNTMTDKLKTEILDEQSQVALFSEEFYPLSKW
jgi:hypothetical protein